MNIFPNRLSSLFSKNDTKGTATFTFSVLSVVLSHVRLPPSSLSPSFLLRRLRPSLPESESICLPSLPTRPAASSSFLPHSHPAHSFLLPPQLDSAINQERQSLVRAAGSRRLLSLPPFICLSLAFNKFVPVNKPSKTDPHYLIKRRRHVEKYDT